MKIDVLDKGYIELVDKMGTDLSVCNAARVSYDGHSDILQEGDIKLINYLAKHRHISPFYHPSLQFKVKAPISTQRQWFKSKIGTAENSESTRYVVIKDEIYVPAEFRAQSANSKQSSSGTIENQEAAALTWANVAYESYKAYQELLALGVAREQARGVLLLDTYTKWVWTASLAACIHFIRLRDEDTAQFEIRQYALAMKEILLQIFPVCTAALLEHWK